MHYLQGIVKKGSRIFFFKSELTEARKHWHDTRKTRSTKNSNKAKLFFKNEKFRYSQINKNLKNLLLVDLDLDYCKMWTVITKAGNY